MFDTPYKYKNKTRAQHRLFRNHLPHFFTPLALADKTCRLILHQYISALIIVVKQFPRFLSTCLPSLSCRLNPCLSTRKNRYLQVYKVNRYNTRHDEEPRPQVSIRPFLGCLSRANRNGSDCDQVSRFDMWKRQQLEH